nr:MAG TPA: hypothetical protein [Caudoviricetes sp.]
MTCKICYMANFASHFFMNAYFIFLNTPFLQSL